MTSFSDTLDTLPSVTHLSRLDLFDEQGAPCGSIHNQPGQAGSVRVYNAVADGDGHIGPQQAHQALALFAEHTAAARAQPGSHPNIDRLLELEARHGHLTVRRVPVDPLDQE